MSAFTPQRWRGHYSSSAACGDARRQCCGRTASSGGRNSGSSSGRDRNTDQPGCRSCCTWNLPNTDRFAPEQVKHHKCRSPCHFDGALTITHAATQIIGIVMYMYVYFTYLFGELWCFDLNKSRVYRFHETLVWAERHASRAYSEQQCNVISKRANKNFKSTCTSNIV